MPKTFAEVKDKLMPDGTLRDFYIFGVSSDDWKHFIALAPSLAEHSVFQWGERKVPLPSSFSNIAALSKTDPTILSLWISGNVVNCHFFVESEIELDFAPHEFQTELRWKSLIAFFQEIVDAIGKKGVITQENSEEDIIDEIMPNNSVEYIDANALNLHP